VPSWNAQPSTRASSVGLASHSISTCWRALTASPAPRAARCA
jgi:hypothetical protein